MLALLASTAVAQSPAVTRTPVAHAPIVRGDAATGFEIRVGERWLPAPVDRVDLLQALPIGARFLVVEKDYAGGNGRGCETHVLSVLEVRDGALVRQAEPRIELGSACWSRDRVLSQSTPAPGPIPSEWPFLGPVVLDEERFELVHMRVERVENATEMGSPLNGFPPMESAGVWTVDGRGPIREP